MIINSSNPWMKALYYNEEDFNALLKERYTEYRHTLIDGLFDIIEEQAAYLSVVQEANAALWQSGFHNSVRILKAWITSRLTWLDSQWLLEEQPPILMGDVDMDGDVDANDALAALRAVLGIETLEGDAFTAADVDGNGVITANDALIILRRAMGLIE